MRHFSRMRQSKKTQWFILAVLLFFLILIGVKLIVAPIKDLFPDKKISNTIQQLLNKTDKEATKSATQSAILQKPKVALPSQINSGFGIPILTYHFIANNPNPNDKQRDALSVSPDKFDSQMNYLSKNGYTPISLDTLYAVFGKLATSPSKPIVLTFDDGYEDFYSIAYPILRKYNFHAVSFIPTGLMGGSYYMNWSQIKEIQTSGLVTFEDHTVTHANLTSLNYESALKQMIDSKNELAAQTGYPVNFIAYPYGVSNESVLLAAQKAGFIGGLGNWFSKATGPGFNMPRIKVSGFWSIQEFASRL